MSPARSEDATTSRSQPPRAGSSRKPRAHRLGIGAAALAVFAAGSVFGGTVLAESRTASDRDRRALAAGPGVLPATDEGAVRAAASCDDLLAAYVERGVDLVGAYGWGGPGVWPTFAAPSPLAEGLPSLDPAPRAAGEPRLRAATPSATGTNVQEVGIDEPDVVKTDGRLLVLLDDEELSTWDVTGDDPRRLGTIGLPVEDGESLLVGDRVVVLGSDADAARPTTEVAVVDLADPADPALLARSSLEARLVEARQHGETVRLVTATGLPDLDFVEPGDGRSTTSALRRNRQLVEETDLDDWLPRSTREDAGHAEPLLPCAAVAVPRSDGGLGTLAVTSLLPAGDAPATPVAAAGLLTGSDAAYVSRDRLYVATTPAVDACCLPVQAVPDVARSWPAPSPVRGAGDGTTQLHAFALDGARTTYVASGEVDGQVRERWWMDERDGVLRLAVGPTRATGDFNSVVTLVEDGDRLVESGRLDKIGVNEDIQSVRWFDEMAVVVTFRRIDPLHVIDLSDDAEPALRGELKMPGFSAYLHPLGPRRLLGIGAGPTPADEQRPGRRSAGDPWGGQAALYDLADLGDPRKVAEHHWSPGSVAGAASDPRQFTWLPDRRVALTVVWGPGRLGRTGRVSVLGVDGDALRERSVEVEYGDDVEDVRLVPLPGPVGAAGGAGRVLLVTGGGVERFDLDG